MSTSPDVFAPPQAERALSRQSPGKESEVQRLRRHCLGREGAIKGMVWLAWGSALSYVFTVFPYLLALSKSPRFTDEMAELFAIPTHPLRLTIEMVSSIALLVAWIIAARGLATLNHRGRVAASIAMLGGMVFFTIASLEAALAETEMPGVAWATTLFMVIAINGALVALTALLWSGPAKTIFSQHYREEVMPATPTLRARIPWWMYLVLTLVAISILGSLVLLVLMVFFNMEWLLS